MRKMFIVLLFIIHFTWGQNYDSFLSHAKHPFSIGAYSVFLNYGSENHFHEMVAVELGLTGRDKLVMRGGFFTETRFQLNWFRKIVSKPFIISLSPGIGSFFGTYIDFDGGIALSLGNGIYLNNQLQVNLYLDSDEGKPFESDSPFWYVLNLHAPIGNRSQLMAEFGLPITADSYTFFGVGFKFYF